MHCLQKTLIIAALVGLSSAAFAQTPQYAVGKRQYNWTRGTRQITTYIYYPATGTPGSLTPVLNAPVAAGVFPICEYTHGLGGNPDSSGSAAAIRPLAAAGFIVPAPHFSNASISDVGDGDLPRDVSQVLTNTIALNGSGTPFTGKINTTMVGVAGYSMGGMTTHALLTAYPDSRIKAAIPLSCTDQGTPSSSITANVMFIHGDQDPTTQYSSARQAYSEMPPTKAFLTFYGANHSSYQTSPILPRTIVNWMLWSLKGDSAARSRLASEASSSGTKWEMVERAGTTTVRWAELATYGGGTTIESTNAGFNGNGYANLPVSGGYLQFVNVNGGNGGTATITIRFANGSTARTGQRIVNGGTAQNITFNSTGSWTTWNTMSFTATLNSGTANTIRFQSNGQDLGNIDEITIVAP